MLRNCCLELIAINRVAEEPVPVNVELPLGRGNVDAMGYERADFRFADLTPRDWVGHIVDASGRVGVHDGKLAQIREPLDADPFLLGRTADGLVHLAWTAPFEEDRAVPELLSSNLPPEATGDPALLPLIHVAADLPADDSQLASRAVALAKWHATFRFCSRCGSPVVPAEAGWASRCTNCGALEYPRMDPVVIMRVTDAYERLLLAGNATWPQRRMSLPAGFVEAGETPPQAVEREVWEEVQVRVENPRYLASQAWPGPRSLMLAFAATVTGGIAEPVPDRKEIREARFFTRPELLNAFETGEVVGPGRSSIARAVISDWLES